ncbi:MAG: hypothetical protein H6828_02035 [Planctomycetes bacterium]|nr:hypothetical protein [Planctomycetota bacterium]
MNSHALRGLSALVPSLLLVSAAHAQWSSDPMANLAIGDAASDQNQAKIVATADGGCYVSWFDGIGSGWDVRLQKLDAAGNELWAHNGVLVRDRSYSSTQDYGLDLDATGGAVLAFRDDNFGSDQVTVQRVTASGTLVWGPAGVQVTNTTNFIASPRVTGCANGDVVVAWTENSLGRVMRLLPNGGNAWAAPVDLTPAAGTYSPSDIHAHGDDVIVSMVHQTTSSFLAPKHLVAQKLDPLGAPLWGATPVQVFDGGSLQIGNYPRFVPDGAGGAVFAWYGVSPLQVYAQHVLANGAEAFPHNGSVGSTNAANVRVDPSACWDATTSSVVMFWEEENGTQSAYGLSGQRFDAAGVAQWGPTGITYVPLGSKPITGTKVLNLASVGNGGWSMVIWNEGLTPTSDALRGGIVDPNGTMTSGPFDVSTAPGIKYRMDAALSAHGDALLVWHDERNDGGDIYGQNVKPDGTLGASVTTAYCFGVGCPCGNDDAGAGCRNGTGAGALLTSTGSSSISAGNLVLSGSGLPSTSRASTSRASTR